MIQSTRGEMGACATKPKVDAGKAPAPEPENKDVDAVVAVQPEKNLEVPVVEVAGEGNQSDKGKEVVVDDDDNKADDQRVKTRSLSNLFKEVFRNHRLILFRFSSDYRLLIVL